MGGGPSQQSTTSPPTIPPYLLPILGQGEAGLMEALTSGVIPSLTGLYSGVPQLGVPGLTAGQQQDISMIQGGQPILSPQQQQAAGMFGQIADPTAEKQGFEQFALPEVMQNAALMGQGTSGAADYAVAQAAIPYQLQAQNTELQAAGGLANIGQQGLQQTVQALEAQGLSRDVAMQMAQSLFNKQQQQWGFGKDLQTFPFSLFGPTIGGGSTSINTGGKF
jgi:hypothetical protein